MFSVEISRDIQSFQHLHRYISDYQLVGIWNSYLQLDLLSEI